MYLQQRFVIMVLKSCGALPCVAYIVTLSISSQVLARFFLFFFISVNANVLI